MSQVSAITRVSHCPEKSTVQRGEKQADKGASKGRSGPRISKCDFITQSFKGLLSLYLVHKIQLCIVQKKKHRQFSSILVHRHY